MSEAEQLAQAAPAAEEFAAAVTAAINDPDTAGNTRLQNLICLGLPIYNVFAAMQGWPQIPLPAFCSVPKNPKNPNEKK
jgi:hypothetical protein